MELIYKDNRERKINKAEDVAFTTKTAGIYLIEISARAKGQNQLGGTDDEDLRVEIDKRKFSQVGNSERYFDSPASFSGGSLKGLKKTVYFVLLLNAGKHTISLVPDISATLLKVNIFKISKGSSLNELNLPVDNQAEDGDRRPWITFVLVDLALNKFITELNLKRRFIDSDDVKVIVDGSIKRNNRSILHKFWYFIASLVTGEVQSETFITNFSYGLHYLEFWSDRMPKLRQIIFYGLKSISTEEIKEKIRTKVKEFNLDSEMIIRLVARESSFNPYALSPKNAKGLFQLTAITIEQIKKLGFRINDPYNVDQNIQGGLVYFNWLYKRYENQENRLEKTLAAWNWGLKYIPVEGSLNFNNLPSETVEFIKFVLRKNEV